MASSSGKYRRTKLRMLLVAVAGCVFGLVLLAGAEALSHRDGSFAVAADEGVADVLDNVVEPRVESGRTDKTPMACPWLSDEEAGAAIGAIVRPTVVGDDSCHFFGVATNLYVDSVRSKGTDRICETGRPMSIGDRSCIVGGFVPFVVVYHEDRVTFIDARPSIERRRLIGVANLIGHRL